MVELVIERLAQSPLDGRTAADRDPLAQRKRIGEFVGCEYRLGIGIGPSDRLAVN
jgi:hypothetical protein